MPPHFPFLQAMSLPCNKLICTQLSYHLPLTINDISLLVSNGTKCLNLFHPVWILFSTAASACRSTCHLNNKTYPLTPDLHWHEYLHLCILCQLLDWCNLYKHASVLHIYLFIIKIVHRVHGRQKKNRQTDIILPLIKPFNFVIFSLSYQNKSFAYRKT